MLEWNLGMEPGRLFEVKNIAVISDAKDIL